MGADKNLGPVWRAKRAMGLGRALQKAGYGTRKEAELLVTAGRVQVDGRQVSDPKVMIHSGSEIRLDQEVLREVVPSYLVLNKPQRVVCVQSDGPDCPLVRDLLPADIPGLRTLGRMDGRSTGLLLASNDLVWLSSLEESGKLEQEYRIQVDGELSDLEVSVIGAGINLPKMGFFKPVSVTIVETMNGRTVLNMVLVEGKIRQLRRMFTTLRHKIIYLRRVRVGPLRLGHLGPGKWRFMTLQEAKNLKELVHPRTGP